MEWLLGKSGDTPTNFTVSEKTVHQKMGQRCVEMWKDETNKKACTYALNHGIAHLCNGGLANEACDKLILNYKWLLKRACTSPIHALLEDVSRVSDHVSDTRTTELLKEVQKALRLALPVLKRDPWRLPGQLVSGLQYSEIPEIKTFVGEVYTWEGPLR